MACGADALSLSDAIDAMKTPESNLVPQTDVYDTHTGKWATIAAEVPRSDLGAIWNDAGDVGLLGPHILVAGGYDEKYTVAYTETLKINPETGTAAEDDPRLFGGWMFASSPGLNAMEHAIYDVWVINCMASEPVSE